MCSNKNFDWTRTIRTNTLMLHLVGLWPNSNENYELNLYTIYAFISVVVIMGGNNFFQVMNIFFVYNDLEALASTVFITITYVQTSVKMCFFMQNIGLFKKLLRSLNGTELEPKNEDQIEIVKPSLKFWKTVHAWFFSTAAVTTFTWSVIPLLSKSQCKQLPLAAWYPYNHTISPLYELTYLYQTVGVWYLAVANIHMDTLMVALMMYIAAQCDILCHNFRNFTNSNKKLHDVNRQIIDCVKLHRGILRYLYWYILHTFCKYETLIFSFGQDSNKFFEMIIVLQFFTSTIILASTMFQLTLVS